LVLLLWKKEETLTLKMVHLILIMIEFGGYVWLMHLGFPIVQLFRPNSMPTLFWSSQISPYEVSAMTTFFLGFRCHLPQIPRNICVWIGECKYCFNFSSTINKG
jgi:hypothetical protein